MFKEKKYVKYPNSFDVAVGGGIFYVAQNSSRSPSSASPELELTGQYLHD